MEGQIDWSALPIVAELIGVDDPAELIDDLMTMRNHFNREQHG